MFKQVCKTYFSVCMYAHIYVCIVVCLHSFYVCVFLRLDESKSLCIYVGFYVCIDVIMHVCMHIRR